FAFEEGPDRGCGPGSGRWRCRSGTRCTRAGSTPARSPEPHRQADAFDQASELSLDDVLQHLLVQRQVRHQLAQPQVLLLELLQVAGDLLLTEPRSSHASLPVAPPSAKPGKFS